MTNKKQKWYVVWMGRNPGVYETWDECQKQVYKFGGAKYKSFPSKLTAERAFKQAYYVVWYGREPGIYHGWEEAEKEVKGFEEAKFQSFASLEMATLAFETWDEETETYEQFERGAEEHIRSIFYEEPLIENEDLVVETKPIVDSICVDAACSGNPGLLEYRGVLTETGKQIFKQGPFKEGTNNIGEFLAIVHAIAYQKREALNKPIYSDSISAIKWVRLKKCKTKLEQTEANGKLFELIERAEKWLAENEYKNDVLKWETQVWGEIPADFGRK